MRLKKTLFACVCAAAAVPALADTRLDYRVEGKDGVVDSVLIGRDKLCINQKGAGHWMLYDRAADTMYYVNDRGRDYTQTNARDLRRQLGLIEAMVSYIDQEWPKQLAHFRVMDSIPQYPNPGEMSRRMLPKVTAILRARGAARADLPNRQQLEEVYRGFDQIDKAGGWDAYAIQAARQNYQWMLDNTSSYQARKAGRRNLGGRRCELTEVSLASKAVPQPIRIIDYCSVGAGELDLSPAERDLFDAFAKASAAATGTMAEVVVVPPAMAKQLGLKSKARLGIDQITIDGIPVHTQLYAAGNRPSSTSTLASVSSQQSFDAALFEVPKGYRRDDPTASTRKALDSSIALVAMLAAIDEEAK